MEITKETYEFYETKHISEKEIEPDTLYLIFERIEYPLLLDSSEVEVEYNVHYYTYNYYRKNVSYIFRHHNVKVFMLKVI